MGQLGGRPFRDCTQSMRVSTLDDGGAFLTWLTAISASSFVEIIRFFTALILNADESLLV